MRESKDSSRDQEGLQMRPLKVRQRKDRENDQGTTAVWTPTEAEVPSLKAKTALGRRASPL